MANLTEQSLFEAGIYQLETTDPVIGGANGISNRQAQELANRTRWIYDRLQDGGLSGEATEFSGDLNTLNTPGFYVVRSTATNKPVSGLGHLIVTGRLDVPETGNAQAAVQLFLSQQIDQVYFRFLAGSTWTSWYQAYRSDQAITFSQSFSGMVAHFAMETAPSGWLACNGAAVSRTIYATLFGRIGTTFGAGNGSTTFNLPDLRGEIIRGYPDGRTTGVAAGILSQGFGVQAAGQPGDVATHTHSYDRPNTVTRFITDLGTGNGDPVSYISNFTSVNTSSENGDPGGVGWPTTFALLACIRY